MKNESSEGILASALECTNNFISGRVAIVHLILDRRHVQLFEPSLLLWLLYLYIYVSLVYYWLSGEWLVVTNTRKYARAINRRVVFTGGI
jgi:hypothetical protein